MVVMAPADENECRQMLYTGFMLQQPAAVRYPRGTGPGVEIRKEMTAIPLGKSELRRRGSRIAILAFGSMLEPALAVGEDLDATVVNMRFVKPIDEAAILRLAGEHDLLVTVEENVVQGGAGSAVNEVLAANGAAQLAFNHGIPDRLIQHGERDDMLRDAGLTHEGLLKFVRERMAVLGVDDTAKSA
jgi:1-deoxy-D-xylulose-5-phosphate synthase